MCIISEAYYCAEYVLKSCRICLLYLRRRVINVLPQNTFTFLQRQQPQKGASHDKPYTWPASYQLWRDCYGGRIPREDRWPDPLRTRGRQVDGEGLQMRARQGYVHPQRWTGSFLLKALWQRIMEPRAAPIFLYYSVFKLIICVHYGCANNQNIDDVVTWSVFLFQAYCNIYFSGLYLNPSGEQFQKSTIITILDSEKFL